MDAFDEDARPFDLGDDRDLEATGNSKEGSLDGDLKGTGEDDIDLVVAIYRGNGRAMTVPMGFGLASDLDELIRQLDHLPGDSRTDRYASATGEFFVICRARGRVAEVLLNDVTATNDWPVARDVVDYLGEGTPDEEDEPTLVGNLEMLAVAGLRGFELEAITTDYEEDSDELLMQVAWRLKIDGVLERAVEVSDD